LRTATPGTWAKAYIDARADALGPQDPWVALFGALEKTGSDAIVVLAPPGQSAAIHASISAEAARLGDSAPRLVAIESPPLPPTKNVSEGELMLALARHADIDQIAWFQDTTLWRVLGKDPLAAMVFQLPPILVQTVEMDAKARHAALARGMHADRLVNEALAHLAQGAYREAAALAVALDSALASEPGDSPWALRARWLVARATSFGTDFPKRDKTSPEQEPPLWERGTPDQGAYAAWLRVLLAGSDVNKAWMKHRPVIASALSPSRLDLLDKLHGFDPVAKKQQCEVEKEAMPETAWSGDLLFANRLATQAASGAITPAEWSVAYDALVGEAQRTGMVWTVLPSLLFERGELPGMSAKGSGTYGRVTRMTVEHLRSLERFQKTAPDKYAPGGQLSIALQARALADPDVVEVLHRLVADNVKYKLAPATNAEDLLMTSLVVGVMGAMLPEPVRSAYLLSLRKGLDEKLRSGFGKNEGGWDLAAVHALNVAGAFLLGQQPDLAFAGDSITRALEANSEIKVRPIALIAAQGVQYGTLIAAKELEPDKVGNAKFGPRRQAARDRLEASLRNMGDNPDQAPRAALGHLTTLVDGLIATTALLVERSPGAENQDACSPKESSRSLPEVKRNLRALAIARDALLRDPTVRDARNAWGRRASLLTVIGSDMVDVLSVPEDTPPKFAVPPERARAAVVAALTEWTTPEVAAGVASIHAISRDVASSDGDWQKVLDARREDLGKVLVGTADVLGTTSDSSLAQFVVSEGARLLSAPDADSVSDSAPKVVQVARALFAANKRDHATMALLVAGSLGRDNASLLQEAERIGSEQKSPATWYLAARSAVAPGNAFDAATLERGLRSMTDDACKVTQVEPLIDVGRAVQSYARGQGKAATDTLDRVLDQAEKRGLTVPRVQYTFDEVLESGRTFRMTMHMTAGQGFIHENSFSVGLDVFSTKPTSGLKVEVPSAVAEDAGRYYAHVASLNSVYHLLDGRDGAGARDAERIITAMGFGVRLGDAWVKLTDPARWMEDLSPGLEVTAQLASQRGHVLLAGDLWLLISTSTPKRPVGKAFVAPSGVWDEEKAPVGIRGLRQINDLEPALLEARTLVERAAACDPKQRPPTPTNLNTCQAYRQAISLWRAGVYDQPPSMGAGATEACVREAALVEVMTELASPPSQMLAPRVQDKIAEVILSAAKRGYLYDAISLLRRVRDRGLCIPALVAEARVIGRHPDVVPQGRVDWLGYSLTCPGRQADETVWEDLRLLAASSEQVGDPEASYRVHTAVVRYMVNLQAWDRLADFARNPGFVKLMNRGGPSGAAMALLVQHTADALAGRTSDMAQTQGTYDIACIRYGNAGREQVCRELGTFRNRVTREPGTNLAPVAEQLLRQVVGL
jgi:hypothetical protein